MDHIPFIRNLSTQLGSAGMIIRVLIAGLLLVTITIAILSRSSLPEMATVEGALSRLPGACGRYFAGRAAQRTAQNTNVQNTAQSNAQRTAQHTVQRESVDAATARETSVDDATYTDATQHQPQHRPQHLRHPPAGVSSSALLSVLFWQRLLGRAFSQLSVLLWTMLRIYTTAMMFPLAPRKLLPRASIHL